MEREIEWNQRIGEKLFVRKREWEEEWELEKLKVLRHRFRFSIDLVLVRDLTFYTLSGSTPYIVIPVFGLTRRTITKDGAREKEIICFKYN